MTETHVTRALRAKRWLLPCAIIVCVVGPAYALSLKSIMGSMADTTKLAKATVGNFDQAQAADVLQRYASDAQAAGASYATGTNAKAQDLRARFQEMAATADGARRSALNAKSFRTAFTAIVGECRSCHSVYK